MEITVLDVLLMHIRLIVGIIILVITVFGALIFGMHMEQSSGEESQINELLAMLNDLSVHVHLGQPMDPSWLTPYIPNPENNANQSDFLKQGIQCNVNGVCILTYADTKEVSGMMLVDQGDNGSLPDAQGVALQIYKVSPKHCQQMMAYGLQPYVYVSYAQNNGAPQNRCLNTVTNYDLFVH